LESAEVEAHLRAEGTESLNRVVAHPRI
jgi:hypothetical protein